MVSSNIYRRENDIPYSWGTAVNVQSMAFGNMGDDCGTGVAFTRNPATGEKKLMGEFLTNLFFALFAVFLFGNTEII